MILIVFNYLTPKGFRAITLFPFIIFKSAEDKRNTVMVNHERIHSRQQVELLVVPFYIWYFLEFLARLVQYKNRREAYRNISFEREAYAHEGDLNYIVKREFFGFIKYL